MSIENVVAFLQATSVNEALRNDLASVLEVGDGDISDSANLDADETAALLGTRGVLVAVLGEQHGYAFSLAQLNTVIGVLQRYNAGQLSAEDYKSALGLSSTGDELPAASEGAKLLYRGIKYAPAQADSSEPPVLEFFKQAANDDALKNELANILATGDGDVSKPDEMDAEELHALRSERGALVADLAAKHGFKFTISDLLAVTDAFQRVQAGEMSEDTFARYLKSNKSSNVLPLVGNVVDMTYKGFSYQVARPAAAQDNTSQVVGFLKLTKTDESIKNALQEIIGGDGDGDVSEPGELDPHEAGQLMGPTSASIVELAEKSGFRFNVSDLSAVIHAFQLVNEGKLSWDSCSSILGVPKGDQPIAETAKRVYRGVRY